MIHVWHTQAIPEGVKTNTALQLSGVLLSLPPFLKTYIFSPWFAIYLVFFGKKSLSTVILSLGEEDRKRKKKSRMK